MVRLAGIIAAVAVAVDAHAAQVTVSGADACVDAAAIADQASDLLGRPLAAVPGVDFLVELRRVEAGRWRLRLDTIEREQAAGAQRARRSRELGAAKCTELADAAAVGIAMSVRALSPAADERRPVPPPPVSVSVSAGSAAAVPAAPVKAEKAAATVFAGRLALAGDLGALPGATVGIELGAVLRLPRVRFEVSGTALAPRVAHATGGAGGEVRLLYGTAESCLPVASGRTTVLGCAGFELGRISAEGLGIAQPRLGSAPWRTVRADVGAAVALGSGLAVVVRAGAGVPLARSEFVIDGTTLVHRPSSLVVRVSTGVELEF